MLGPDHFLGYSCESSHFVHFVTTTCGEQGWEPILLKEFNFSISILASKQLPILIPFRFFFWKKSKIDCISDFLRRGGGFFSEYQEL